ncbi:MAG TPA: hypothetical protein VG890_08445 [Puia sp.]|nr:hypothetical protein [Puia sp.]
MSTYLLLRNNKESGPYSIDEIKQLSLKSYDLVWVEGKSAAWRYPGEIPEFSTFAPPVPEQPFDRFYKKTPVNTVEPKPAQTESVANTIVDPAPPAFSEAYHQVDTTAKRESQAENGAVISTNSRNVQREIVYINLPATEKRTVSFAPEMPARKTIDLSWEEPERSSAGPAVKPAKKKGRGLLIGSVLLFFGAGLATGFYISNRRIFFPSNGNSSQQLMRSVKAAELPPAVAEQAPPLPPVRSDDGKSTNSAPGQPNQSVTPHARKKVAAVTLIKQDSTAIALAMQQAKAAADSVSKKAEAENQKQQQMAKIKAHPEEYLIVAPGNYKVGVLGGLSEIPVTVTNRSGVSIDLVVVAVDYVLHNKKIFKTENLNFHDLAPGASAIQTAPKSPRGVKITCRLMVANSQ